MRKAALVILVVSGALTSLSAILWLVGLIAGIGGSLIHLFLLSIPLWLIGVVVGIVLLVVSGRDTKV
ncbi:MAG TPA: hypothetical protein VGW12_20355 [Pyrinomonadaceae bacterium]|nr:hypothetical protein [Pyrinomonadaceae bacterium]